MIVATLRSRTADEAAMNDMVQKDRADSESVDQLLTRR